jgi:hypothetical protein
VCVEKKRGAAEEDDTGIKGAQRPGNERAALANLPSFIFCISISELHTELEPRLGGGGIPGERPTETAET